MPFFAHQWLSLIIFASVRERSVWRSTDGHCNGAAKGLRTVTLGVADQERITGSQSSNSSFGFLDYTFQFGYLPEEFRSRPRSTAEQHWQLHSKSPQSPARYAGVAGRSGRSVSRRKQKRPSGGGVALSPLLDLQLLDLHLIMRIGCWKIPFGETGGGAKCQPAR